ncbi:MAG: FAD-dependent monooxygenase [Planctomycetaceae bacterium]|nr:FAD-dependent monooxygenase [Planctomycetaceae bacterium]
MTQPSGDQDLSGAVISGAAFSDARGPAQTIYDVVVIGAGVAGGLAALLTAQRGLSVLLLEKDQFPRHKVCGGCLNRRAVDLLRAVGAEAAVATETVTSLASMQICLEQRRTRLSLQGSVVVARDVFDAALVSLAVAAGAEFLDGVTAEVLPEDSTSAGELRGVQLRATYTARHEPDDGTAKPTASEPRCVQGRIVLVCDGLGHASLRRLSEFRSIVSPNARIGVSVVCPLDAQADAPLDNADLHMAVTRTGYAGCVQRHDRQLNLAAAIDAAFLQSNASPVHAMAAILQQAGVCVPAALKHYIASSSAAAGHAAGPRLGTAAVEASKLWVRGTPPLSRTSPLLASDRVLLLGDSTGYVEPFTGEGMAWAIVAAVAVQPIVHAVVSDGWRVEHRALWQQRFAAKVGNSQRICRFLSRSLQFPWLLHPMLTACQLFPFVAQGMVRRLNRIPSGLEWQ